MGGDNDEEDKNLRRSQRQLKKKLKAPVVEEDNWDNIFNVTSTQAAKPTKKRSGTDGTVLTRRQSALKKLQKTNLNRPILEVIEEEEEGNDDDDEDEEFHEDEKEEDDDELEDDSDEDDDNGLDLLGSLLMLRGGLGQQKVVDTAWKNNLTEAEIEKYEWIFKNLEDLQLDVPTILRSNLTDKEKEHSIYVMANFAPTSATYEDTARLIKKRKDNPVALEKLQHYEKLEQELMASTTDRASLKHQILDLQIAPQFKRNIWDVFEQIKDLEPGQSDYHKHYEWLQWVIRMPFGKYCPMPVFRNPGELRTAITSLRESLDQRVYGMSEIKEEIMLFSMDRFLPSFSQHRTGKILVIEGSPGVGKTHLIRTLATCWKLPFVGIAAGGCKDVSFWEGHGRTYEGAIPGRIVHAIKEMKAMNGVIYIDEIDKLSDQSQDVSSALMHILDESQNSEWYDKFFQDVPLDLSKIFWVLSINDRKLIHPVLRDRLHIIKVPDPSVKDKIETAKRILIPEMMDVYGLEREDIVFPDDVLKEIILEKTDKEKGLRRFKRCLEGIVQRVAYLKHTLVNLPSSAIWYAAQWSLQNNQPQPTTNALAPKDNKDIFSKQTSFYFPEFRIPLPLTNTMVQKLLVNFKPDDTFDYAKSGWVM